MRHYKRKTNRRTCSADELEKAFKDISEKKTSIRKIALSYKIPVNTLRRKLKLYQENKGIINDVVLKAPGYRKALTNDEERVFVRYLKGLEEKLFFLTRTDVRRLAYQFAERYHPNHPFNKNEEMAGQDWMINFIKRHPQVAIKKAERTSSTDNLELNEEAVLEFFSVLNMVMKRYNFSPSRIYNAEETNITIVPNDIPKLELAKGKTLTDILASDENSDTVTAEMCFSATGMYMPMMIVFPRPEVNDSFLFGALPGTWAECHPSGRIQADMFYRWLKKFIEFSGSTKENPVLLILNGHASYIKNLDLTDLAEDNGVVIVCLSSHIKHEVLPIDVTFMKTFNDNYIAGVREWLRENSPKVVTIYEIAALLGSAFLKTATPDIAVNGFSKTGIYPFNTEIYPFNLHLVEETNNQEQSSEQETSYNLRESITILNKQEPEVTKTRQKYKTLEQLEESANLINYTDTLEVNLDEPAVACDQSSSDDETFTLPSSSLIMKEQLDTKSSIKELKLEEGQLYIFRKNQLIPVTLDVIIKKALK